MLAVVQNTLSLSVPRHLFSMHYTTSFCISTLFHKRRFHREEESETPSWACPVTSHMKLQMQMWLVPSRSGKSFSTNCGVTGKLEISPWRVAKAGRSAFPWAQLVGGQKRGSWTWECVCSLKSGLERVSWSRWQMQERNMAFFWFWAEGPGNKHLEACPLKEEKWYINAYVRKPISKGTQTC